MPTVKELLAEAALRRPITPPEGYLLDTDNKISDALRKHKEKPYVDSYVPPVISRYEPPPIVAKEQEEPVVVAVAPVEDEPCVACESGDCFKHRTEDIGAVETHDTPPIVNNDNPVAAGESVLEIQTTPSSDESNPAPEGVAEKPEPIAGDSTGTAPTAVTPVQSGIDKPE